MSDLYYLLNEYPYGLKGEGWDVDSLCANPQLPWQYVREHPEGTYTLVDGELRLVDWNWCYFSQRNNLDCQLVREFPDKPWDWEHLSIHDNLDCQLVREFPDKPWNWGYLSSHTNLDWQLVRDFPDKDWAWYYLSERGNLDWQLIREFPDKDWDWDYISWRDDLDWRLVRDLPDKPWTGNFLRVVDINEILANLDAYTTRELSSFMFDGQVSGLMTKSARSSGSH